jgi:hypothetical protein
MKKILALTTLSLFVSCVLISAGAPAADPPAKPKAKIVPGKVIVPTGRGEMQRPWGELVSMDLKTRSGTFRKDGTDEVVKFTVMPYSELLHHATFGDLQDFRIGERAIFRLHENEAGEWALLTYIQDEMNFLKNHGERYQVDSIDAAAGTFVVTQGNWDDPKLEKPFIRTTGITIGTDADTRYWKAGEPAKFTDIKIGDRLRTKTHGTGSGNTRVCWEVFLDDESLLKFQAEQKAVHAARLAEQGAPGYVDAEAPTVELTLFQEGGDVARALKAKQRVSVTPCGVDRNPSGKPETGVVTEAKMQGNLGKVKITLDDPAVSALKAGSLARLKPMK